MRLQLEGTYNLDEFEVAVSKFVDNLRTNNIETINGINVYFNPCVYGAQVKLHDSEGNEIEHMILDYARHRQFRPSSDDLSIVTKTKMTPMKPSHNK